MGNRLRIVVSVLLSIICLTILSLHVALCLHYPSPLFAVTLLLNPSLWLFIGLMSMFCTLLIDYRDQRRKLVPALCSTCRPKHESAPLLRKYIDRSKYAREPRRQNLTCYCSKRFLSSHQYPKESSVQTSADVADLESASLRVVTKVTDANESSWPGPGGSSPCCKSAYLQTTKYKDIQNFSCLLLNTGQNSEILFDSQGCGERSAGSSAGRSAGSSANPEVPREKKGRIAYYAYGNDQYRLYATSRPSSSQFVREKPFPASKSIEALSNYNSLSDVSTDVDLQTDEDKLIDIKASTNEDARQSDSGPICAAKDSFSAQSSSGAISKQRTLPNTPTSLAKFGNNAPTCTCPVRYYLKYNTRGQVVSKSKPIMKCSLIHKAATPVHLFQVKLPPKVRDGEPQTSSRKSPSEEVPEDRLNSIYDSDSCSSLVALIPNK